MKSVKETQMNWDQKNLWAWDEDAEFCEVGAWPGPEAEAADPGCVPHMGGEGRWEVTSETPRVAVTLQMTSSP